MGFFSLLFRLTPCLPVSRKAPFFLAALFVCMRLRESYSPLGWATALLLPALGVSTVPQALDSTPECVHHVPLSLSLFPVPLYEHLQHRHELLLSPVSVLSVGLICLFFFSFCPSQDSHRLRFTSPVQLGLKTQTFITHLALASVASERDVIICGGPWVRAKACILSPLEAQPSLL